jgi:hypothetical protein
MLSYYLSTLVFIFALVVYFNPHDPDPTSDMSWTAPVFLFTFFIVITSILGGVGSNSAPQTEDASTAAPKSEVVRSQTYCKDCGRCDHRRKEDETKAMRQYDLEMKKCETNERIAMYESGLWRGSMKEEPNAASDDEAEECEEVVSDDETIDIVDLTEVY